ncbi:unnamed protein product [Leuciscus chuanchicus]
MPNPPSNLHSVIERVVSVASFEHQASLSADMTLKDFFPSHSSRKRQWDTRKGSFIWMGFLKEKHFLNSPSVTVCVCEEMSSSSSVRDLHSQPNVLQLQTNISVMLRIIIEVTVK